MLNRLFIMIEKYYIELFVIFLYFITPTLTVYLYSKIMIVLLIHGCVGSIKTYLMFIHQKLYSVKKTNTDYTSLYMYSAMFSDYESMHYLQIDQKALVQCR